MPEADDLRAAARRLVDGASRVVVLTGAGISTESGIPDFRGPKGVWTKNPAAEKQSTIQHYLADPDVRRAAWRSRLDSPAWTAEPNAGHRAVVALERRGKLHALVTQNIDELHQRAGSAPDKIVEVHGSMRRVMCWQCGRGAPMGEALARVRAGEDDPHCLACGGILKSDTISFGQSLVPEVIDRAMTVAAEADLLIAVGTTLQVMPVAGMVPVAAQAGARVVIVNDQPTAMDALATVVIREPIGAVLAEICGGAVTGSGGARAEQVLHSVHSDVVDRCVDFFRRADCSFGYREFRRDPEDQGRWSLTAAYDLGVHADYPQALAAALGHVPWLAAAVARSAPFVP